MHNRNRHVYDMTNRNLEKQTFKKQSIGDKKACWQQLPDNDASPESVHLMTDGERWRGSEWQPLTLKKERKNAAVFVCTHWSTLVIWTFIRYTALLLLNIGGAVCVWVLPYPFWEKQEVHIFNSFIGSSIKGRIIRKPTEPSNQSHDY